MSYTRHGLSIGIERVNEQFFLTLKAQGTLTHADYEVINPMIDSALARVSHPRVKALIDAEHLDGWELRAAWDDFKLGLKHGSEFEKIAIYGGSSESADWLKLAAKMGDWFTSGEVKFFRDYDDAMQWLNEE
ncbi:MAG: STAS/SEC14 domain-containing protein [Oceanobacter sp.]